METGKKLTLEALLAKKEQREMDQMTLRRVEVSSLGGYLVLEKIPLTRLVGMLDRVADDSLADNLALNVDIIYACCPLFRNKELQEQYHCAEPTDIVCAVLDDNMADIDRIVTEIMGMYGLTGGAADLKVVVKN